MLGVFDRLQEEAYDEGWRRVSRYKARCKYCDVFVVFSPQKRTIRISCLSIVSWVNCNGNHETWMLKIFQAAVICRVAISGRICPGCCYLYGDGVCYRCSMLMGSQRGVLRRLFKVHTAIILAGLVRDVIGLIDIFLMQMWIVESSMIKSHFDNMMPD